MHVPLYFCLTLLQPLRMHAPLRVCLKLLQPVASLPACLQSATAPPAPSHPQIALSVSMLAPILLQPTTCLLQPNSSPACLQTATAYSSSIC